MSSEIQAMIQNTVHQHLRFGYGDPNAPLAVGEYVRERLSCPHNGCTWELDTEWWTPAGPSRYLGHERVDQECQAHLETHLPPI